MNNKILGEIIFDSIIMGGALTIPRSLKTKRNNKFFQDRPRFFLFFKSYTVWPFLILANNRFSKIRSINSGRDGFMC